MPGHWRRVEAQNGRRPTVDAADFGWRRFVNFYQPGVLARFIAQNGRLSRGCRRRRRRRENGGEFYSSVLGRVFLLVFAFVLAAVFLLAVFWAVAFLRLEAEPWRARILDIFSR